MKKALYLFMILVTGFFSCTKDNNNLTPDAGVGGSLARFTIVGNNLYTMDDQVLSTYNISVPDHPVLKNKQKVGAMVETIFPFNDKLFMGGRTGFYIYDIQNPDKPKKLGIAQHLHSCDPVVANDSVAFVSLRGGTPCSNATNALYIYDISKMLAPQEIAMEPMDHPEGLGLKGWALFVCDSTRIIVMDVKDPYHPLRIDSLSDHQEIYHDVIPYQDLLICMVKNGILLYNIADINRISLISQIKY